MTGPAYWHGGQRGLRLGERILPPSVTRVRLTTQEYARRAGLDLPARPDRVYVTTSRDAALLYAALHPSRGWVYQVAPDGELEPDPDCSTPGLSFACPSARIVRVMKVRGRLARQVLDELFRDDARAAGIRRAALHSRRGTAP